MYALRLWHTWRGVDTCQAVRPLRQVIERAVGHQKVLNRYTSNRLPVPISVTSLSVISYVGSATASRNTILACCV